jgi:UDP-glucose 4-epimerase
MSPPKDQSFYGARVVITGGVGFIGSHIGRRLASAGAKVTLVDSLIPEYGGNLANIRDFEDDVLVNIADVRDRYSMEYLVKDADILFNLAGQTSHLDSMRDPYPDLEINARAQLSTLEACRQHNPGVRVVFAGTRQIYGKPQYLPVDEQHPIMPIDINGVNKAAGENYHLIYHTAYGLRTTVLRLTNTYGPGMRVKDARQTFVGIWIKNVLSGVPIKVYGNGKQVRDLADLLVRCNGSGSVETGPFPDDLKGIDIGDYYSDDSAARSLLDWAPQVTIEDGLERTLEYYQAFRNEYFE